MQPSIEVMPVNSCGLDFLGGKGVPQSVAERPAIFLTLTAPSFGAVHTDVAGRRCRPGPASSRCRHGRVRSCSTRHDTNSEVVGSPLCHQCYDYAGAVLQNACTPELWRRTMIYMHRCLAGVIGCTQSDAKRFVQLSFCRVAEYQRRGVVHLHAVIRADGPEQTVPVVGSTELMRAALQAAKSVTVTHPRGVARWGDRIDAQILEPSDGKWAKSVAAYVAKYATKSSDGSGSLDVRIRSARDLAQRRLPAHLHRMAQVSWDLGGVAAFEQWHLRRHAHGLGYGGHFLSKSKGYSTTLGALRAARQQWRMDRARNSVDSDDRSLRVQWRAVGIGWANGGEASWAEAQRRRREEEKKSLLSTSTDRSGPSRLDRGLRSRSDDVCTGQPDHGQPWARGETTGPLRVREGPTRIHGPQLIDISELAQRLATSQRHVRRLVDERRVPYLKIGHYVRFDPADIEAWLDQHRVSMADSGAEVDGPPWVRLCEGPHGGARQLHQTASRRSSPRIDNGHPLWIQDGAAKER